MSAAGDSKLFGRLVWCACKTWELLLRAMCRVRGLGSADRSQILIDAFTAPQRAAIATLQPLVAIEPGRSKFDEMTPLMVVVPFRDRWEMTEKCIRSLYNQELFGRKVILILADNGSIEPKSARGINDVERWPDRAGSWQVTTIRIDRPFNFSSINNDAVRAAHHYGCKWVLFLNNDVEFRSRDDLTTILAFAENREDVGAVGCTLDFPDGAIQHLFVAPGIKIVAAHPLKGLRLKSDTAWFLHPQPVAAVTGAVMLMRIVDFDAVGGFDENLPTVGQDVDLCLKLQKLGRINWVVPQVRMVHHEGASRGGAIAFREVEYIYGKWGDFLRFNPYFSDKLSRFSEPPVWTPWPLPYPWRQVMASQRKVVAKP